MLATSFGQGHDFLATWQAWREDAQRCDRLIWVALAAHPLAAAELARSHQAGPHAALAERLITAWPPATPGSHGIDLEDGRVQLLLGWGEPTQVLDGLQLTFDTLALDEGAHPWDDDACRRLARLAAPGARLVSEGVSPALRASLARHGFVDDRYAPRFHPVAARGWARPTSPARREALVIGAGLAGAAAAWGLARAGWQASVLDRHAQPAQEASGNAGGLVHMIFNAPDSLHARWFRAAALATAQAAAGPLSTGEVAGALDGFLRLEPRLDAGKAQSQRAGVGLPQALVDWREPADAAALAGLPLTTGAWLFERAAGWLDPAGWTRWMLAQAGVDAVSGRGWIGGCAVARLLPPRGDMDGWTALDAQGHVIAQAPVVVLANALDANRLLPDGSVAPQISSVRGQVTRLPADLPGLLRPTLPLSGQGYGLSLPSGEVLIGATTQHEAPDASGRALRLDDQRHNLRRAAALGIVPAGLDASDALLPGRAGWRAVTPDRLPLVGPVVDAMARAALLATGRARLDGPRQQPRRVGPGHGLYLCTGLGSRGITSALLAGRLLAAWVSGDPMPVDTALRDALDPARDLG